MTWKDVIKKKLRLDDADKREIAKEVVKKLELEKIPDEVQEIFFTSPLGMRRGRRFTRLGKQGRYSMEDRIIHLIEAAEKTDSLLVLMENKIFADVLGDLKYDFRFEKDD